jgi:ABC-type sugar transport system ATPase subunit
LGEIELSHHTGERLNGSEVELGIRPEAIELSPARGGENVATVARVDRLGDVCLIVLQSANSPASRLVVKVPAASSLALGDRVAWRAEWNNMHWFQKPTGERIEL